MDQKPKLTPSVVDGRPGYVDDNNQTFAAPKASKRIQAWKERLAQHYTLS